jgi:hypothetical protein
MNIIAFDPGQKGGIAIHHQGINTAHPMPLAGKVLDLPSIANLIRSHSPSIAYCRRAFPDVPLVMPRCRNPHDGIADSLCILQYGLRTFHNIELN